MRKPPKIIIVALCLAAFLVTVAFLTSNNEPHYQGHSLTHWLTICTRADTGQATPAQVKEAQQAIRSIGTNAIPYYLDWILYKPRPWDGGLRQLISPHPALADSPLKYLTYSRSQVFRSALADCGFQVLGEQGTPAIPALTNLLVGTNLFIERRRAIRALACMGPDGRDALLQLLANPRASCKTDIVLTLGDGGPPEVSIPVLTNALASTNRIIQSYAVRGIRNLGTHATSAIPALKTATHDPYIRDKALDALRKIAPEALTNAPPQ